MTDPGKERSTSQVTPKDGPDKAAPREQHASKTAGTDRDHDQSGESMNQGHAHPREERDGGDSGR
jgi:hypothetical protein